ncbi:MAG: Lrp/AsnC family transcriptional regulator [Candidatus Burarchaeum sp.]|nr:Lrp/AsnC family transcriptional regulator [Candidatus Burarchaeum sp.]MDO8340016.1 Lrp/AsnC family transcriptional regulator [Candidatus Burarchaeum sp.]
MAEKTADKLDEKDERILDELRKDSRQSTADISRRTDIPRVTVHERIRKLKEKGVIKSFTIASDYAKLGMPTSAYLLIGYQPHQGITEWELAEKLVKTPYVYEVNIISGDYDMLVKVRGASIEDIGRLVVQKVREMKGVGKATTMACYHTFGEKI